MACRNLENKRAIITGASSGIGRALAIALASRGVSMVLVARRNDKLQELACEIKEGGKITSGDSSGKQICQSLGIVIGDITEPSTRSAIIETAREQFGGIDLVVNNAGTSAHGRFASASEPRLRRIMEVNFFAVAELTRAAIPILAEGHEPIVVNIGSILGRRGVPYNSEYCASKFALVGWSESIRPELARLGIDLLLVNPGTTDTEFFDHLIEKQGETPWPRQKGIPPERVARAIVRAIERGQREIVPHRKGQLLLWANRLFPRLVDRLMQRWG
ncbi:MAG: SDR family NAD(P)-dependent oxidoreductase [Pirellulales bacterium]|nr:SDR family NAD(P)-dependent oxidoreductase [Pirellulales bacterium]